MKTLILQAIVIMLFTTHVIADTEKSLKTKPEKVTVYLSGAQIFRNSSLNLSVGMNQLVFEGLENTIDAGSIQAGGNGNFIITEVQHVVKYPELEKLKITSDVKYQKLIRQLNDSLIELNYLQDDIKNKNEVLATERHVLLNYRLFKGESKKDTLALLKDGLAFLREKLNNINTEVLRLKKENQKIENIRLKINERLQQINNELGNAATTVDINKPNYCVIVSVLADNATNANITINYYVDNASWTPSYDLRTNGVETPVKLTYKALVHQSTGIDWTGVKLTLSTANPHQNFTLPQLNMWYIDQPVYTRSRYQNYPAVKKETADNETDELKFSDVATSTGMAASQQAYDYTTVDENVIQVEFDIKLPYTIPSDGKQHYVSILNKDLDTKYVYKTVPKLDQNVYLTAQIVNWEELNLLPGEANIFYEGTFVGSTNITTSGSEDTLMLSLGQDRNVVVKRTKIKDKSKDKLVENEKVYYNTYEIVVRNGNARSIDIIIEDQLPLSRNKTISITKTDISNGAYDELTGKLVWKHTVKSKDTKKLSFGYTVKAPKDMPLAFK